MHKICKYCAFWHYDKKAEEYFGHKVGRCALDGSSGTENRICPFVLEKDEVKHNDR